MSFQPLGGISWGTSAWRPWSPLVTSRGSVSWLAPAHRRRPPPARRGPRPPLPWPSLALPPAVLRPTSTAVASMPTRRVDLAILRVSPGRFLCLPAASTIWPSLVPV